MARKEICAINQCTNDLGPGSARVGYETDEGIKHIKVCPKHAFQIMSTPAGLMRIEDAKGGPKLVLLPRPMFFT